MKSVEQPCSRSVWGADRNEKQKSLAYPGTNTPCTACHSRRYNRWWRVYYTTLSGLIIASRDPSLTIFLLTSIKVKRHQRADKTLSKQRLRSRHRLIKASKVRLTIDINDRCLAAGSTDGVPGLKYMLPGGLLTLRRNAHCVAWKIIGRCSFYRSPPPGVDKTCQWTKEAICQYPMGIDVPLYTSRHHHLRGNLKSFLLITSAQNSMNTWRGLGVSLGFFLLLFIFEFLFWDAALS